MSALKTVSLNILKRGLTSGEVKCLSNQINLLPSVNGLTTLTYLTPRCISTSVSKWNSKITEKPSQLLKLYKVDGGPPSRAVMMLIDLLKLDVEDVELNLIKREHLEDKFIKINPQQTVPTLIDGDFVIWDSHAIATYLVSKYAKDDSLYPSDLKTRAIIDQRLHFDSGILFPVARSIMAPVIFFGGKSISSESLENTEAAYVVTEKFLEKSRWIAGNELTVADISCVSSLSTLNIFSPVDSKRFPNLTRWLQSCSELECYKNKNLKGLKIIEKLFKKKNII